MSSEKANKFPSIYHILTNSCQSEDGSSVRSCILSGTITRTLSSSALKRINLFDELITEATCLFTHLLKYNFQQVHERMASGLHKSKISRMRVANKSMTVPL